ALCAEVLHLLFLTNALVKNDRCIRQIQQMHSVNLTDPPVENNRSIPKDSTKVPPKETTKTESSTSPTKVADATTPTVPSFSSITPSEKQRQRPQAAPPTTEAAMPSGKTANSSTEGQPEMPP